ncbi:hypothetical protein [Pigmentiphaga aceris]|uniref:hypothetical protein n=1 Tax=Pigmentiphaga aceris TaxID=1940612 RepID=UPI0016521392|nr:hypothetical protein [Pigmentiphaga aceris]
MIDVAEIMGMAVDSRGACTAALLNPALSLEMIEHNEKRYIFALSYKEIVDSCCVS